MSEQKTAYPLTWPAGKPRTQYRERSRFDTSFAKARSNLIDELEKLGARKTILSTNVELRLDGLPYANRAEPSDKGVAIYFEHKGKPMAFCCDRWDRVGDNIHAIALTIGALRGIARWGTGDMMEAAFTGYAALPSPTAMGAAPWRTVLGVSASASRDEVETAYRRLRSEAHPDRGGDADQFDAIQRAWEQAQGELS